MCFSLVVKQDAMTNEPSVNIRQDIYWPETQLHNLTPVILESRSRLPISQPTPVFMLVKKDDKFDDRKYIDQKQKVHDLTSEKFGQLEGHPSVQHIT